VTLAKDEVAVLRDIAHNISANGKEVNLWEMMNAINSTIRCRFHKRFTGVTYGYSKMS
jgi:hypothetical protein